MVTAGVYMIARTHFLFDRSPFALSVVAIVGAATALFAATIALVQNDIKRVLAYSTISQLGYMFLGCGVAAYSAAIFHLMTHAFFKALLFLAAGSVIHALGGEQDMRKMGGLRKKLPVTFWTMTAAVLAIAGFFPFAGFFSKDAILYAAFLQGTNGKVLWFVGLVTALLTAFYMFRLWYMTFMGESRTHDVHPHESPWSMRAPLVILAATFRLRRLDWHRALQCLFCRPPSANTQSKAAALALRSVSAFSPSSSQPSAGSSPTGSIASGLRVPGNSQPLFPPDTSFLLNKYFVDEIYGFAVVKPLLAFSKFVLEWVVDVAILGGLAWLLARHRHACRRNSAAVAVGQSALVCGMAGSRCRCAASLCAGSVEHGAGWLFRNSHWHGGALRDGIERLDSHVDPAGPAGRSGLGCAPARSRQAACLDCAAYHASSASASPCICPRILFSASTVSNSKSIARGLRTPPSSTTWVSMG